MSGGLFSGIPYARSTKTSEELDLMSTKEILGLAAPTKEQQIDLIEYLEQRWLAHRCIGL